MIPGLVRGFILRTIRKRTLARAQGQGIGKHSRAEIEAMMKKDLDAIETLVGDGPYALGSKPSTLDCTIYPFAIAQYRVPWKNELTEYVKGKKNLVAYCERIDKEYWGK